MKTRFTRSWNTAGSRPEPPVRHFRWCTPCKPSDAHQLLNAAMADRAPLSEDQFRLHRSDAVGAAGASMHVPNPVDQNRVVDFTVRRAAGAPLVIPRS